MPRPKRGQVELDYVELVFTDGHRWRVDYAGQRVQCITEEAGQMRATPSVPLTQFITELEQIQEKRNGTAG